jgi:hypothetical protein
MKDETMSFAPSSLVFVLCSVPHYSTNTKLKEPKTEHQARAFILHPAAFILQLADHPSAK